MVTKREAHNIVSATVFLFSFIAAGLNRNWRNEISLVEEIEPELKKQNEVDLKKKKKKRQSNDRQ